MNDLPAFEVVYEDGSSYITNMAAGTTLQQAKAYLMQAPHVSENPVTGKETRRHVKAVRLIQSGGFTFQDARTLRRIENSLYNKLLDAWNAYQERHNNEQQRQYETAHDNWSTACEFVSFYEQNYPEAFAPFSVIRI